MTDFTILHSYSGWKESLKTFEYYCKYNADPTQQRGLCLRFLTSPPPLTSMNLLPVFPTLIMFGKC